MTLRFGLLGTGYWAEMTHGAALVAHPGADLVGVWGRDPVKARALAGRLGCTAYVDIDELIAAVDVVAVALPPDIQADLAERAALAGRHLLLDKPLALTVEAADRVVAAVEQRGVASVIFFTRRFNPAIEAVLAGAVGGSWDGARVTMLASIFGAGSPYANSPWRRVHGGLWDIGPHALSLVLPVLGPVADAVAVAGPHATSHVLLRHEGGAVTSVAVTLDAPAAATAYDVVFFGATGRRQVPEPELSPVLAFGAAIDRLLTAVAGGGEDPCDVHFGREVVAILARAEASMKATGR